jgi:hypothetical protein
LSQQGLWSLIDQAWFFYGCNKEVYDRDRYQSFVGFVRPRGCV